MLGAVIYKLRALNSSPLPLINGRLMHATFFNLLHEHCPALEHSLHDMSSAKPFTVSMLDPLGKARTEHSAWQVRRHDEFIWRLTSLDDDLLRAELTMPLGQTICVGDLMLSLEEVIADGRPDCGLISKHDLIAQARSSPLPIELTLRFTSPTTFRIDDRDAPYPRSDLIFSSLADKWAQCGMPATIDRQLIRSLSTDAVLTLWSGQSRRIYFARDRGALSFWGEYVFNVERLEPTARRVFELLSRFAEYSGVGRLTAQGFGQTRVAVR